MWRLAPHKRRQTGTKQTTYVWVCRNQRLRQAYVHLSVYLDVHLIEASLGKSSVVLRAILLCTRSSFPLSAVVRPSFLLALHLVKKRLQTNECPDMRTDTGWHMKPWRMAGQMKKSGAFKRAFCLEDEEKKKASQMSRPPRLEFVLSAHLSLSPLVCPSFSLHAPLNG